MAATTGASHNREVLERLNVMIGDRDYDALGEVLHPDFVQEMPQSGERVVGIENFRRILENMPGLKDRPAGIVLHVPYIGGDEEHYILTPTFQVVKVADSGDELTSYVQATYPDGSEWYVVTFTSFKDGKVIKRVDLFAPFYDAPEWRSAWVTRV